MEKELHLDGLKTLFTGETDDFKRLETKICSLKETHGDKVTTNEDEILDKIHFVVSELDLSEESNEFTFAVDLAKRQGLEYQAKLTFELYDVVLNEDNVLDSYKMKFLF